MLSDLYLPLGVNPQFLKDESVSPEPIEEDVEEHNSSPIKSLYISDDLQPPPCKFISQYPSVGC